MNIWITLVSGDPVTGLKTIARSGEPDLVRRFIAALQTNRLLEDDADDVIYDPAFPAEAGRMIACLTEQIRRNAVSSFSEVEPACSEADLMCSLFQGPAPDRPNDTGPNDTGPSDTGPNDTGPSDTGPSDTGPSDTGRGGA